MKHDVPITIGRIVHYQINAEKVRPLIVTEVLGASGEVYAPVHGILCLSTGEIDGKTALYGQKPSPVALVTDIPHDSACRPGTWHWPKEVSGVPEADENTTHA